MQPDQVSEGINRVITHPRPLAAVQITENFVLSVAAIHSKAEVRKCE